MENPTDFIRELKWRDGSTARYVSLREVEHRYPRVARFPASIRILLEAALRRYDGELTTQTHLAHLLDWRPGMHEEVPVWIARVLLQDASGIPLLGDLAAMRTAARRAGAAADAIQLAIPADLVIDHSVSIEAHNSIDARQHNLDIEYAANAERYEFVKWAAQAFKGLRVVPPGNGIVHQINLEYLATAIVERDGFVFPDTVVGTDSHTTMINGLGVLGWGVGGLEAEIALLGQPVYMQMPDVVGVQLTGTLSPGVTVTDAALQLTRALRETNVVGHLLEFIGPGVRTLDVPDRATIANMAPEYGATSAWFAIDDAALAWLARTGRSPDLIDRIRAYYVEQKLFGIPDANQVDYTSIISFDLSAVRPTVAGPSRPQQSLALSEVRASLRAAKPAEDESKVDAHRRLKDGDVVLAAITSCTNTANPIAMIMAGLLARAAAERGLRPPNYVKTVLAPGSRAAARYLARAGLLDDLQRIGFFVSAYGCAVCVGNSGPLNDDVEEEIDARKLSVAAVLSGNRNFEGRIHRAINANYLASPALVVAYALAGTMLVDLDTEPVGRDMSGEPVFLRELWPDAGQVQAIASATVDDTTYEGLYSPGKADIVAGTTPDENQRRWDRVESQQGAVFEWRAGSSYFVEPPFFCSDVAKPRTPASIVAARVLAVFGDAVTTDHISPVGEIAERSDAAAWLRAHGIERAYFNSYGARRCNHHVMMRGTFANSRIRNLIAGVEPGPMTRSARDGAVRSLFEVAQENLDDGVPSVIFAGHLYGAGSARDWAAKGTALLGVSAVLAKSFERIHRTNLVLTGVLPVELPEAGALDALEWLGSENVTIEFDAGEALRPRATIMVARQEKVLASVQGVLRIDTAAEWRYIRGGGALPLAFAERLSKSR